MSSLWKEYYRIPLSLVKEAGTVMGITITIHPDVLTLLNESKWQEAKDWCEQHMDLLKQQGYMPDGLKIKVGDEWKNPLSKLPQ